MDKKVSPAEPPQLQRSDQSQPHPQQLSRPSLPPQQEPQPQGK